jgi:tRNA threonylcarbamoyl adenosine modification protein (Sua5/YciO/YrdC/YwlC family)
VLPIGPQEIDALTELLMNIADTSLARAARFLRSGGLVAFPTETVYGLGADASSAEAVRQIYRVKGRPSSDPLIVHVASLENAERLVDTSLANSWQLDVLRSLAEEFWPGPLTIILPAHPSLVAFEVTSGTGWVGLRSPAHPIAQRFLQLCEVPVAAPSANTFGHVSPTTAEHVVNDFPHVDNLWILDGGRCGFGIESTVVRVNSDQTLDIFRRGGVGLQQISENLLRSGLLDETHRKKIRVVSRFAAEQETAAQPAPGQLLVHYAPRIPAHMVRLTDILNVNEDTEKLFGGSAAEKNTVVLDFAGYLSALRDMVGFYRDLSPGGDPREAAHALFDALRWAEDVANQQGHLWIFDPAVCTQLLGDEIFLALQDRIVRAASGRKAEISLKRDSDRVYVLIR